MEPEARTQPPSIEALTAGELPFVLADDHGVVIAINQPFREVYGGGDASLVGASIGQILPESFRMAHQLGFSRFTATEQSTIPGHPLRFKPLCAAGRAVVSEHFIVAQKDRQGWIFGATRTPLSPGGEPDPSVATCRFKTRLWSASCAS